MGSRPSAPVTYRPSPTAPVIYQSVIPEEDFKLTRDYVNELKAERAKKKKNLEDSGFGSSDMAARQKQYLAAEQATYQASQPKKRLGGSSTP